MINDLHVVFGAGQVGQPLARRLQELGLSVRVVRRSPARGPAGTELVAGDALDPAFCREAARGATTVYHCLNPAYSTAEWAAQVPRYTDNLIAAAGATGAKLVVLDNLYALAPPHGRALNEESPIGPVSRKGTIRAAAAARVMAAHAAGVVLAVIGRASDFYGPGGTATGFGDYFWPRVLRGARAYSPFPLDAVHTYHYIPDVAAALAVLGRAGEEDYGRTWMLPCQPAESARALVARFSRVAERDLPVGQMPRLAMTLLSLAMPALREIDEMLYQWNEPFVVDDRRFRERFNLAPTPLDDAALATWEWAERHYARR